MFQDSYVRLLKTGEEVGTELGTYLDAGEPILTMMGGGYKDRFEIRELLDIMSRWAKVVRLLMFYRIPLRMYEALKESLLRAGHGLDVKESDLLIAFPEGTDGFTCFVAVTLPEGSNERDELIGLARHMSLKIHGQQTIQKYSRNEMVHWVSSLDVAGFDNGYQNRIDGLSHRARGILLQSQSTRKAMDAWAKVKQRRLLTDKDFMLMKPIDKETADLLITVDNGQLDAVLPFIAEEFGLAFGLMNVELRRQMTPDAALDFRNTLQTCIKDYFALLVKLSQWPMCNAKMTELVTMRMFQLLYTAQIVIWKIDLWEAALSGCEAFIDAPLEAEFVRTIPPQVWVWNNAGHSVSIPTMLPQAVGYALTGGSPDAMIEGYVIAPARVYEATEAELRASQILGLDQPVTSIGPAETKGEGLIFGIILAKSSDLSGPVSLEDGMPRIRWFPPLPVGAKIHPMYAPVVAALRFMQLPLVTTETTPVSRPVRRRIERENSREKDVNRQQRIPEIRTIYLRRKPRGKAEGNGDVAKIEHDHQWYCNGFWRNQWYPSLGVHKQRYIEGHWRGPEDKPMKMPGQVVYAVAR